MGVTVIRAVIYFVWHFSCFNAKETIFVLLQHQKTAVYKLYYKTVTHRNNTLKAMFTYTASSRDKVTGDH